MPAKLYVGNLDKERPVEKEDLEDVFNKFGRILEIWVARQPPGFAFITYDNDRDADEAANAMDGKKFQGEELRVQISTSVKGGKGGGRRGGRSRSRGRGRGRDSRSRSPPRRRRSPSRSDSRRRRR
eukprot:TRINITY_DN95912_c0_g1_i1.p1 TRINITY_DN95912_c0_g1~~TRINITY_DN95912_c0_g1_i1.p1  ORF type:complete len:126 (-),score=18.93 TRINITY_DN95912_c0_g1_i1:78-455(-)